MMSKDETRQELVIGRDAGDDTVNGSENGVIIEVSNLHKIYSLGSIKVHALKGVTFSIRRGEFASIMGPSGSGKSTLFNIIGTLDSPTRGSVRINGKLTTEMTEEELTRFRGKELGFVFQNYNLIPVLSALENVMLPMAPLGVPEAEQKRKAMEALKRVGLEQRANHYPDAMSGGEQQRACIARALVNDPAIILADEPTGNLDQETGRKVITLFKELNETNGQTFLIITHDPSVAAMTRRIIHLEDGKIVQDQVDVAPGAGGKAVSLLDRMHEVLRAIPEGQDGSRRTSMNDLAEKFDLEIGQVEGIIERMVRRQFIQGYIMGDELVVERIVDRGATAGMPAGNGSRENGRDTT